MTNSVVWFTAKFDPYPYWNVQLIPTDNWGAGARPRWMYFFSPAKMDFCDAHLGQRLQDDVLQCGESHRPLQARDDCIVTSDKRRPYQCQAGSLQPSRLQRSWKPRKALRDFFLAENRYSCWIGTDWRHGWDFTSLKYSQLGFVCSISSIRSTNL